jgi:hypothetical protein
MADGPHVMERDFPAPARMIFKLETDQVWSLP